MKIIIDFTIYLTSSVFNRQFSITVKTFKKKSLNKNEVTEKVFWAIRKKELKQ